MKRAAIPSEEAVRSQRPAQVSMPSLLKVLQMVEKVREELALEVALETHLRAREVLQAGEAPVHRCSSQARSSHPYEMLGLDQSFDEAWSWSPAKE